MNINVVLRQSLTFRPYSSLTLMDYGGASLKNKRQTKTNKHDVRRLVDASAGFFCIFLLSDSSTSYRIPTRLPLSPPPYSAGVFRLYRKGSNLNSLCSVVFFFSL